MKTSESLEQNQHLAWSSGLVLSKIWMAEILEKHLLDKELNICSLGGWHEVNAFILFCRDRLKIRKYLSIDVDPTCKEMALQINKAWQIFGAKFQAQTMDANVLNYSQMVEAPNLVINTSVEAMSEKTWWVQIPQGTFVLLQTMNLKGEWPNFFSPNNIEEFIVEFKMQEVYFSGVKEFNYPESTGYKRFMIFGRK